MRQRQDLSALVYLSVSSFGDKYLGVIGSVESFGGGGGVDLYYSLFLVSYLGDFHPSRCALLVSLLGLVSVFMILRPWLKRAPEIL